MDIGKSKLTQIESLAETIKFHFGENDPRLDKELEKLINMIKEEKERTYKLSDLANLVANRI